MARKLLLCPSRLVVFLTDCYPLKQLLIGFFSFLALKFGCCSWSRYFHLCTLSVWFERLLCVICDNYIEGSSGTNVIVILCVAFIFFLQMGMGGIVFALDLLLLSSTTFMPCFGILKDYYANDKVISCYLFGP